MSMIGGSGSASIRKERITYYHEKKEFKITRIFNIKAIGEDKTCNNCGELSEGVNDFIVGYDSQGIHYLFHNNGKCFNFDEDGK